MFKFRMKALSSVRNVLSLTRRRSTDTEEKNLFGTSMESGTWVIQQQKNKMAARLLFLS